MESLVTLSELSELLDPASSEAHPVSFGLHELITSQCLSHLSWISCHLEF